MDEGFEGFSKCLYYVPNVFSAARSNLLCILNVVCAVLNIMYPLSVNNRGNNRDMGENVCIFGPANETGRKVLLMFLFTF